MTHEDLMSKLRLAGVARLDQVQAMVLETTGDVSVIKGDTPPDPRIVKDIRRTPDRPIIG
jgi:uncharacterized membrane protein YcaP (DUF421 family)